MARVAKKKQVVQSPGAEGYPLRGTFWLVLRPMCPKALRAPMTTRSHSHGSRLQSQEAQRL
jgi:hypothetical protein